MILLLPGLETRLILVFIPLFPHVITFVLSVLISSPTFSLEALTRSLIPVDLRVKWRRVPHRLHIAGC